ncbi:MAG: hypothetical protein ACTHLE_26845 [Agriterribacter sp.]
MNRLFSTLTFLVSVTLILSCTSQTNARETEKEISESAKVEQTVNEIFGINGEDIPIKTTPAENGKKLVNEKATKALGETQYCQLDYSTKVEILETKNDWSKIKVVEPDWLSATHVGWEKSDYNFCYNRFIFFVVCSGIEPPTQGFSVLLYEMNKYDLFKSFAVKKIFQA